MNTGATGPPTGPTTCADLVAARALAIFNSDRRSLMLRFNWPIIPPPDF